MDFAFILKKIISSMITPLTFGLILALSTPNGNNIKKSEIAIHEYLGLIWAKIGGQI